MRSLAQWLDDYEVCHTHATNRLIHHICVPAIQFSLLGLLWLVALPLPEDWPYFISNLAFMLLVPAMVFYFMLSWRIAIGMLLLSLLMLAVIHFTFHTGMLLELSITVFLTAWVGQFIGHMIEGKSPSFFEDLRFLLIGPLWVLSHLYTAVGLPQDGLDTDVN